MQERRAGSRPALRHPWRVAVRQLVKTFPLHLLVPIPAREPCGGTARWGGGVSLGSPHPNSDFRLVTLCSAWGGGEGWTVSPGHPCPHGFCDRTGFSPPRLCAHGALSPGVGWILASAAKPQEISPTSGVSFGFSCFSPFRAGRKA